MNVTKIDKFLITDAMFKWQIKAYKVKNASDLYFFLNVALSYCRPVVIIRLHSYVY